MTSSRISYNINTIFVPDRATLADHLIKIQPHWVMLSGTDNWNTEIRMKLPRANVIFRESDNADMHKRMLPQQFLDDRRSKAPFDSHIYLTDRPNIGDTEFIMWTERVMDLAEAQNIKLCVGNFGEGQPQANEWNNVRGILDRLNRRRDLFVLGLHEYATGIITSGVVGGVPTMIRPLSWPTDVSNVPLWHMGRYRNLMTYCQQQGIPVPRIVITHTGFDDMGDLTDWLQTLAKWEGAPYTRGYRTLFRQWEKGDWLGGYFGTLGEMYFEQLKWANDTLYKPFGAVEAQLIYCWGTAGFGLTDNTDSSMDISQERDFHYKVEAWAQTQPDYLGYADESAN